MDMASISRSNPAVRGPGYSDTPPQTVAGGRWVWDQQTCFTCALDYIASMAPQWSNEKSEAQWTASLSTDAFPIIGDMAVSDVDTAPVLRVVEPLWTEKTETASRVRWRIEAILDYGRVKGYRAGDNPARWKGSLELTRRRGVGDSRRPHEGTAGTPGAAQPGCGGSSATPGS